MRSRAYALARANTSPRCAPSTRSEEHTPELQSPSNLVCRPLLDKNHPPPASLGVVPCTPRPTGRFEVIRAVLPRHAVHFVQTVPPLVSAAGVVPAVRAGFALSRH